jgi:hypothetical protein
MRSGGSCHAKAVGNHAMQKFDPQLVQVMRNALEEVMTKVPLEYSTSSTKAFLAECILKAAAQGQTSYDQLVAAAADQIDQIQVVLAPFIWRDDVAPLNWSEVNWSLALRKDQTMKRKRQTEEQIIAILKEHEAGFKTANLCRKHGISEASF